MSTKPILTVEGLTKVFGSKKHWLARPDLNRAVDDVSFDVYPGETLALVGESGSGKTTTGRMVLRLEEPTAGRVVFEGRDITRLNRRALRPVRRQMQVVFQDPYAALSPRMSVGDFVVEPLLVHGVETDKAALRNRAAELFRTVGLDPRFVSRYPHEFSGGQRQRIGIARAICLEPKFIVADEPITALDVSIQAQIINLLQDLQEQRGLAYLFIAHDLNMVRYLCHRVAVMLAGRIVEIGPTRQVFTDPRHPYTQALLSAVPVPDPDAERLRQRIPYSYSRPPAGEEPKLREVSEGHYAAI